MRGETCAPVGKPSNEGLKRADPVAAERQDVTRLPGPVETRQPTIGLVAG